MSYFVYRSQNSDGARELATALEGTRVRNYENGRFFRRRRSGTLVNVPFNATQDRLVMWGSHLGGVATTVRVLNNAPMRSKYSDIEVLRRAGVPTVEASRTRPAPQQPVAQADPSYPLLQRAQQLASDFSDITVADDIVPRTMVFGNGVNQLTTALNVLRDSLGRPVPVAVPRDIGEWVGRVNDHIGGEDLLRPPTTPDYYVRKVAITDEYRVHSFLGRSIRAGVKQLRDGFSLSTPGRLASDRTTASPWIRSWDGGWRIVYDGVSAAQEVRDLAHRAVTALGLDFGAVDIGRLADGTLIVLEVNRAPGLEGGTITRYVDAIRHWGAGEWSLRTVEEAARNRANRQARTGRRRTTTRRAA